MIKLRLSDLEAARQNPSGFRGGSPPGYPRQFSMMRTLHYSVYEYHRRREDIARAAQYLEDMFHKHFKRQQYLPQLLAQLAQYDAQFRSLPNAVVRCRARVSIAVDPDLQLSGEIPRIDLAPNGGYAVWFFGPTPYEWRSELRMPVIQGHFASQMMVAPERVTVGFYFFDLGLYDSARYSPTQIAAAFAEAHQLGSALIT
jgi:hypothetical protein